MSYARRFLPLVWIGLPILAVALWAAPASAVSVHLRAAFSAATLHGTLPTDDLVTRGMRKGIGGGIAMAIPVRHGVAIQPELLYVMKGTTMGEISFTDDQGNVSFQTGSVIQANDYLELPVLARIALPFRGPSPPWMVVGPVLGYRLSSRIVVTGEQAVSQSFDQIRRTDLGVALGAGADLGRVSLESRYTLGLTPAAHSDYGDDARNGTLLVMVGYAVRP